MVERLILPINPKPELDCYTHYSNTMAIVTNPTIRSGPDSHCGGMKWDFKDFYEQTPENPGFAVNEYQCDSTISSDDTGVFVTLKSRGGIVDDKNAFCSNFVVGDGSFTVRIDWIKKISPWVSAGIMLFACGDNQPPSQSRLEWERVTDMRIGVIGRGDIVTTIYHEGNEIVPWTFSPNPSRPDSPVWLRITREGDRFTMLCSADGENFEVHRTIVLKGIPEKIAVGFITSMRDDGFYAWFYQNHIQLHCAKELSNLGGSVPIDFFGSLRINDIYTITNPWIKTDLVSYDTIVSMMPSYVDFAIKSLLNGYYVESTLNECYLPFSSAFLQYDFPHRSMIYGFDMKNQIFYVLGYDENKHYSTVEVPFGNMEQAFRKLEREQDVPISQTCLFKPSGPEIDIEVNTGIIKRMLTEYVNSTDSGQRYEYMRTDLPRVYGLAIYDEIIPHIDVFLNDVRISYLLHEHKKVMCNRIRFITDYGKIDKENFDKLIDSAQQAEKLALMLRNYVIKYSVSQSPAIKDIVINKLSELKSLEQSFYPELIKSIKD